MPEVDADIAELQRRAYGPDDDDLSTIERARLAQFEKADSAALDRYGWIDRDHGFVQIPIARAMELLARRGLPGWPGGLSGKDQVQDGSRH